MTDASRVLPLWASLTYQSSRDQVLAAVAESEEQTRGLLDSVTEADFDNLPPENEHQGCYWSRDGQVVWCYGRGIQEEDPVLAVQRRAGEEDQSVPGWDQGA